MKLVIGFRVSVFADEKQDTVSAEAGACFLEIVLQALRSMCNTVEQGRLRNELLHRFQHGRRIPAMKVRSRLRGRIFSGRGSPQSVFFVRYDPEGGDRAKKSKRA